MTMQEMDLELVRWQRQWRAQDATPPDLARSVEAGTRSMRRGIIAEILVTVVMGGGSIAWALATRRPDVSVLAIAVWIFIAVAWTASLLLRRGAWQPATATTAAFVDISILRCERSLQAIWIQVALYVVILTFDFVWLYFHLGMSSIRELLVRPASLVALLVVTPMLAAAAMWYRRRLLRELKNLVELRRAG
jgi:pimeloyl-ACP methyl ester carboxylesterase